MQANLAFKTYPALVPQHTRNQLLYTVNFKQD